MTRNEAIEILESVSFFAPSDIDVDTAIDTAIRSLEAWDKLADLLIEEYDRSSGMERRTLKMVFEMIAECLKEVEE